MVSEKLYSAERGEELRETLPQLVRNSKYALSQLGIHMVIGATFAYDLIPLPLGTISRVAWVAGNRIYWSIRRDRKRKEVHSWAVLGISAIPWVGYLAYTIPLRKTSEDLCFISAYHLITRRHNQSLKEYLEGKPRLIRGLILRTILPKEHKQPGDDSP